MVAGPLTFGQWPSCARPYSIPASLNGGLCLYADGSDSWPASAMFTHSLLGILLYRPAPTLLHLPPPNSPSILCRCDAVEGRSRSCSSRPVLPSMLLLRVSGAELQHRPPLSNILRTLIHTPEREGGLSKAIHTHKLSKACVCVYLLTQTPSRREKTHLLRSFADSLCASVSLCVCVCFASGTMRTHTSVYCK